MKFRRKDAEGKNCCPSCGCTSLVVGRSTFECRTCAYRFPFAEVETVQPKKGKGAGSGVVAGKITIGRGSNWRAGY